MRGTRTDVERYAPTLTQLRRENPHAFYAHGLPWFDAEPFMRRPLPVTASRVMPCVVANLGQVPSTEREIELLPWAVELAALYLKHPDHFLWKKYLWCRDVDEQGQRIYLGGVEPGRGLQIHRHLAITTRWASVRW